MQEIIENTLYYISTTLDQEITRFYFLSQSLLILRTNNPIFTAKSPLKASCHIQSIYFEYSLVGDLYIIIKTWTSIHRVSLVPQAKGQHTQSWDESTWSIVRYSTIHGFIQINSMNFVSKEHLLCILGVDTLKTIRLAILIKWVGSNSSILSRYFYTLIKYPIKWMFRTYV